METITLRSYRHSDAAAVSRLFREVYGNHYVHPHVYLPMMISQNHSDGLWHSLVAVIGKKILGHATLCRKKGSHTAEMALGLVHPTTRGQNIATQLCQRLMIHAQALGCRGVMVKQVTQHPYSQQMGAHLGFCSTALLLDHVASPFGQLQPESIVIGFSTIDDYRRPLPALAWPESCRDFMLHVCSAFGTQEKQQPWVGPPIQFEHAAGRYEVVLKTINSNILRQLRQLPEHWMISIRLRLAQGFTSAMRSLSTMGFMFTGVAPDDRGQGWLALFHRGYRPGKLALHCPHMQRLHDQAQQPFRSDLSEPPPAGS